MNLIKVAVLSAFALVFAACGPKNLPSDWNKTPPPSSQTGTAGSAEDTGSPQDFEDLEGDEESLTSSNEQEQLSPADERAEASPTSDKVSNWINNNAIPENAKLAVIYFGFDRFNVEAEERAKLDAIIETVKRGNVFIVGYSDYYGTEEYNLALSDKRAQAVKNYLINLGADDSAQVRALGEAFAVQNGTREEVAEDRKVIVVDGNAE